MSTQTPITARTFGHILAERAQDSPDAVAFTWVPDAGEHEDVTYAGLHARAETIAAQLLGCVAPGDRALLLFAPGLDYVAGVYACFEAGVVGVAAMPPHPKRLNRTLPRLLAIAEDAAAGAVLTTAAIRDAAQPMFTGDQPLGRATWVAVDEAPGGAHPGVVSRAGSDLAFLQYTSGSTSDPRGVMLTHENLLLNSRMIERNFGHTRESRAVVWLPPYHDMGLIGGVLQPVFGGFPCALMSPTTVIKRPERWLQTVSEYRAGTSGGPNFAYDLAVRRIPEEKRAGLDLSCWDVAFNGAEPILASTLDAFAEAFAPHGFDRSAFHACYGLAESTLMVTAAEKGDGATLVDVDAKALELGEVRDPADGSRAAALVGCGHSQDADHEVAIVDPTTLERCAPDRVGEIWCRGPSVAEGYWRRDEDTRALFAARIDGEDASVAWLRTGDLGFVRDGQLYIVGRVKDLIILHGRNYHPHDLELSAEAAHDALRPHCSAAFSIAEGGAGDGAAILLEVDPTDDDLGDVVKVVRRKVAHDLDVQLHRVALVGPGTVPKTTSGKVQRQLCRRLLDAGELEPLADWRPGG